MKKDPKAARSLLDDLIDQEPELHHYTTYGGLKGILETNTIWATHFKATNDKTEFTLLHSLLFKEVKKRLEPVFAALASRDARFRAEALRVSGSLEDHLTNNIFGVIDAMYDFDIGDPVESFLSKSLDDAAFVTCFCAHSSDSQFTQKNGLLSQWRGYSASTKYCIVFDTSRLIEMARREADHHLLRFMTVDKVLYVNDEYPLADDYQDIAEYAATLVESVVSGRSVAYTIRSQIFQKCGPELTLLGCATRIKHQGFSEEREFRIVIVRGGPELHKKASAAKVKLEPRRPKTLRIRSKDSQSVPYIALFDELGSELPIKRIIVGPSSHQKKDYEMARKIIPSSISIELSAIPFWGQ